MNKRVVLLDPDLNPPSTIDQAALEQCGARLDARLCKSREELLDFCRGADAIMFAKTALDGEAIQAAAGCKILARMGTGYDNVDLAAAGALGIPVTNIPEFCVDEVADHTWALILACWRKLPALDRQMRSGHWDPMAVMPARRLRGKTLGLVGFGRIGQAVANRATAFGVDVTFFDPGSLIPTANYNALRCENLETLLTNADIVSLHLPLNDGSKNLIGASQFSLMKPDCILINTARGKIIEETALIQALRDKRIGGAGLDTYTVEPLPKASPLFSFENVVLSPHCAAHTLDAFAQLRANTMAEVVRALNGEPLHNVVNSQFLKK